MRGRLATMVLFVLACIGAALIALLVVQALEGRTL